VRERTAGAAHPAFDYRVGEHFTLTIPTSRYVNAVTGTDWEGAGVVPDVSVPNGRALQTAELIALEKLIKDDPDYPFMDERRPFGPITPFSTGSSKPNPMRKVTSCRKATSSLSFE
jgi:hypothetical protein